MHTNTYKWKPIAANASQQMVTGMGLNDAARHLGPVCFYFFYSFIYYLSYTIFTFPLFFDFWFFVLLFWLPLDFVMPQHLFHFLIPSLVHLPSSITLSLHHPHSHPLSSVTLSPLLSMSLSSDSLPLCPVLFLSSHYPIITPCLPIPTLSILHSVPCDSVSHFVHSPYYSVHCTTPSIVVYKSFQLVVYSSAGNCHPLLFTQSPPSLPLVSHQSPPWQYNRLVSPLLVSSEIKDNPVPWQGCNT